MLSFHDISKAYGSKQVLSGISYQFGHGVYALHGPNGIGKSTLLSILAGIVAADAGRVLIDGYDLERQPLAAKARLAYVPDECPVYPFMTCAELLNLVASAKKGAVTQDINELVKQLGLTSHLGTRFGEMSLGTQKKAMIAASWIGNPAVTLMDEPSNGLDRAARGVLIERVLQSSANRVILISTHDAEFAHAAGAHVIPFEALQQGTRVVA